MSTDYGNRLSPNMYWPAPGDRADTTPADNQQLFALIAALEQAQQTAAEQGITVYDLQHRGRDEAEQGDPQWAGPSLPHPSEATSEEEAEELREGWDDYHHGIEPNQEVQL